MTARTPAERARAAFSWGASSSRDARLIDLDPRQLEWISLTRESTDRDGQLDHQLTDLRC